MGKTGKIRAVRALEGPASASHALRERVLAALPATRGLTGHKIIPAVAGIIIEFDRPVGVFTRKGREPLPDDVAVRTRRAQINQRRVRRARQVVGRGQRPNGGHGIRPTGINARGEGGRAGDGGAGAGVSPHGIATAHPLDIMVEQGVNREL